ncbi:TIGR03618 family F420-dependent PPOX class oxidoreductase [Streptantibioticus ferralitis]|uniref:TIGR03618 family F420-dependent PPOX class oxidoreductase n=1 Tax=Streptantibioticus ferralitis TaxID=236510 RepID=A0ABT5YUA9_9ACTN|nr:TIGR03618 family F420-dependent PPOX class oxidoreductase [Streptantibioticus ferralitis]MDF2255110.1 TIGR03618 family F420-dependent PPOX class oxidoreductase [Streptantibioticus ferralitis]
MTDLKDVARIAAADHNLAVVATTRADGSVQASVVNAGITDHPVTGEPVVALVTYGRAKLANLRARPRATLTFRAGWNWATVEGRAEIVGPDDPFEGIDAERLRLLLREIFTAAGGSHDDWAAYDRTMAEERRAAVLVHPERVYSN